MICDFDILDSEFEIISQNERVSKRGRGWGDNRHLILIDCCSSVHKFLWRVFSSSKVIFSGLKQCRCLIHLTWQIEPDTIPNNKSDLLWTGWGLGWYITCFPTNLSEQILLTPTEGAAAPTISLLSSSKDTYGAKGLVHHHPHHPPPPPPHDDQVTPMVGRRGAGGCSKGGAAGTCFTEAAISNRRSFNPRQWIIIVIMIIMMIIIWSYSSSWAYRSLYSLLKLLFQPAGRSTLRMNQNYDNHYNLNDDDLVHDIMITLIITFHWHQGWF